MKSHNGKCEYNVPKRVKCAIGFIFRPENGTKLLVDDQSGNAICCGYCMSQGKSEIQFRPFHDFCTSSSRKLDFSVPTSEEWRNDLLFHLERPPVVFSEISGNQFLRSSRLVFSKMWDFIRKHHRQPWEESLVFDFTKYLVLAEMDRGLAKTVTFNYPVNFPVEMFVQRSVFVPTTYIRRAMVSSFYAMLFDLNWIRTKSGKFAVFFAITEGKSKGRKIIEQGGFDHEFNMEFGLENFCSPDRIPRWISR